VKRSGPLRRSTPLRRSSEGLQRSQPPERRTRLRPVSKKRQRTAQARRLFVEGLLKARPYCEAGMALRLYADYHRCSGFSTDVHEVRTRARGGSILDPANCRAICRACHSFIHENPNIATWAGLLESQFGD
jgi:hypothetical protein